MQTTVYAKTGKGRQEIEGRMYGLTAKERRILILVDAQRDAAEIIAAVGLMNEADALFARLHKDGFVHLVGRETTHVNVQSQAIRAPTIFPVELGKATPSCPVDVEALALIKQIMAKATNEHLGLLGVDMVRRIDLANDADSIKSCIANWNMAMRQSRSGRDCVDKQLSQIELLLN